MNPSDGGCAGVTSVSVIIVSWNGRALLEEFLPSVLGIRYPNYEVILMDNASTDGSVEFVRGQYPQVRIVCNTRNDGTAEGSNVGAKVAKGDLLFFISNDMWLDPDILTHMVAHMDTEPDLGICTVKMRRITREGEKLTLLDSVAANTDVFGFPDARGINEEDRGQWDRYAEVCFSFGGAMLIRRKLYEELDGYDPAFFTLADDIDLSWRVRLLGYKVCVEPKAFLYHRVSATLDTPAFKRAWRRHISERNTMRAILKNYSALTLAWLLPVYLLVLLAESSFFVLLGQWQVAGASPRAAWWNLRHLGATLELRRKVQSLRRVPDSVIRSRMVPGVQKFRLFVDFVHHPKAKHWAGYFGAAKT